MKNLELCSFKRGKSLKRTTLLTISFKYINSHYGIGSPSFRSRLMYLIGIGEIFK